MIVLSCDFGLEGPYIGQVKAALYQGAPRSHIIDLFSDLPAYNPHASSALLAAYSSAFPADTVFLSIVDPGVGMSNRRGVVVQSCGHWFVGPDNGLFNGVMKRDGNAKWWEIIWRPMQLSNTFHGRDLFAPVAAAIASCAFPSKKLRPMALPDLTAVDADYAAVAYIDHFGNLISGIRAEAVLNTTTLALCHEEIVYARTFGEVEVGELFWYKNANGLIEIAVNCGSAAKMVGAVVGDRISLSFPCAP